jgi:hypothetical protein
MKRIKKAKLPLALLVAALAMVCVAALAPSPAHATDITLTDQNSVVTIDPTSQAGVYSWTVNYPTNSFNQLYQQWFWYRVGSTGPESPLNNLGTLTVSQPIENLVLLTYTGSAFTVKLTYLLTGSAVGSNSSDLAETIRIHNNGTTPLDLHFFQYTDFDLNGPENDIVTFTSTDKVRQTDGIYAISETVITPEPSHHEGDYYSVTLNKLNDGNPTTLSDNPAIGTPLGPGDMTWAYEWDFTLGTTDFIISKDKHLVVPIPPAALLLGSGLLGLVGIRLKRRA